MMCGDGMGTGEQWMRNGQWLATQIRYPPLLSIFQINFADNEW